VDSAVSETPEQPDAEIAPESEPLPAAAPATAAAEETEVLPTEKAAPKPEPEVKKPDTPKKPEPKKEPSFSDELAGILTGIDKPSAAARPSPSNAPRKEGEAPRRGVGDNQRMTITVADFIRSQMLSRGCWNDQDDMADARRLRAEIRVRFSRDGRFIEPPELVTPARPPTGDPPMQVFVQRAFRGLQQCSPFTVPPEYYETNPPQWIVIEFIP
jgi:hypothetical protein